MPTERQLLTKAARILDGKEGDRPVDDQMNALGLYATTLGRQYDWSELDPPIQRSPEVDDPDHNARLPE